MPALRSVLLLALFPFGAQFVAAAEKNDYFEIKDIKPNQKATGYTIFSSSKGVESFEVEILGKMANQVGPGQDLVIARVVGGEFNTSNVAAGMSGSPVYVDGKLLGALSYAFGQFTTNAIAGITPIRSMLEGKTVINQVSSARTVAVPLMLTGASPSLARLFGPELQKLGLGLPILGAGGFSGTSSLRPNSGLRPGDAFSVILISGDMNLSALGTVTWVEGKEFLGFGHGFLQTGESELPVAGAEVVTTVFGKDQPYKMGQPTREIGVLTSDRISGVRGVLGRKARTVPMSVQTAGKTWHYTLARTQRNTPFLAGMALSNSLAMTQEHELGGSYVLNVSVKTTTGEDLSYQRMVTSVGLPLEPAAIAAVLEPIQMVLEQSYVKTELSKLDVQVRYEPGYKMFQLVAMSLDGEPEIGRPFEIKLYTQPFREELKQYVVRFTWPAFYTPGAYQVVAVNRSGALGLERDSGSWAEIRDYGALIGKIRTMPKDTEVCFYAKQLIPVTSVMGTGLTELPISLRESFTSVSVGSEVLFNSQAVRLGCLDLGGAVTGKVSKSYGEKK